MNILYINILDRTYTLWGSVENMEVKESVELNPC